MTWEIAVGLFTMLSAMCGVMKVVIKVNKTLTALDISVKRLNEYIDRQDQKNERLFSELDKCDRRLHELEREHVPRRRQPMSVWSEVPRTGREVKIYEEDRLES